MVGITRGWNIVTSERRPKRKPASIAKLYQTDDERATEFVGVQHCCASCPQRTSRIKHSVSSRQTAPDKRWVQSQNSAQTLAGNCLHR
jgi:hypothetical protein